MVGTLDPFAPPLDVLREQRGAERGEEQGALAEIIVTCGGYAPNRRPIVDSTSLSHLVAAVPLAWGASLTLSRGIASPSESYVANAGSSRYGGYVATYGVGRAMGENRSSAELPTEAVELSEGMLRIIGAYGVHGGAGVRDLSVKAASQSPPPEPTLVYADDDTSEGARPRATG